MKLRYTIEETRANGTKEVISRDVEKDAVVLGRGSACDILLDSQNVSLQHARIIESDGRIVIHDLGSLSGLIINDKIEKQKTLQEGDEIKLSDVVLHVIKQDGIIGLLEKRVEKEKLDNSKLVERDLKRLQIANRLPSMSFLALALFVLTSGMYFVLPWATGKQDSWSSGPISNKHRMFGSNCRMCHSQPFAQVKDKDCLACHNMTKHSEYIKDHAGIEGRCATCHMEHNGAQVVQRDDRLCTNCHADINHTNPDSSRPNVVSFDQHPEFSVYVKPAIVGSDKPKRIRLNDSQNLKDNSNIKLNHSLHLKPIRSKTGIVQLQCRDCHNASADLKTIQPINFEKHCNDCHGLEFDDRLKGREVPHGDPDVVFKYLYAEYAKLLLNSQDSEETQQTLQRFKPGGVLPSVAAANASESFKRTFVEKESRAAEQQLFTKTGCFLCHRFINKESVLDKANTYALSLYEILKPEIPELWMPGARFNHGSHEEVRCEECHSGVRESTKTTQVLMPKVETCKTCHSDLGEHGLVKSDCVMCHSFHDQKLVEVTAKKPIEEILHEINK